MDSEIKLHMTVLNTWQ